MSDNLLAYINSLFRSPQFLRRGEMHQMSAGRIKGRLLRLRCTPRQIALAICCALLFVGKASGQDSAAFMAQNGVPTSMTSGETVIVSIAMENKGSSTWTSNAPNGGYKLGSQCPQDNTTWGVQRVPLPSGITIRPGASQTFTFTIQAPSMPGTYGFCWKMVREGVAWFGQTSTSMQIQVKGQGLDEADFTAQNGVPTFLLTGQTATVSITMRNSGLSTWTSSAPNGGYKLGSQCPQDNTTWGVGRLTLPSGITVRPGSSRTFTFTIRAPSTPGTYRFCWKMVREGVTWFGQTSTSTEIQIRSSEPTLDDFWDGRAKWVEDSTPRLPDLYPGDVMDALDGSAAVWAYTNQELPGIPFPGCAVLYKSLDGGATFTLFNPGNNPNNACLADDGQDRATISGAPWYQQQYPQVVHHLGWYVMVYENGGAQFYRRSLDGIRWSGRSQIPTTGGCPNGKCNHYSWEQRHMGCDLDKDDVGTLRGSVPGLYSEAGIVYVFYGGGTYPGSMGVLSGITLASLSSYTTPLFTADYRKDLCSSDINVASGQYMAKYVTSANILKVDGRYYMTFEGQRRWGEWGLGLARTASGASIRSHWEVHPSTIGPKGAYAGVGHASFYRRNNVLYLYRGKELVGQARNISAIRERLTWK